MNNKLILVVVLVVLVLGGALLFSNKANNSSVNSTKTTNENQNTTPTAVETNKTESASVDVTSSGFVPQTITIKAGKRVVWNNKSGGPVTVNSDSHPTHLLFPFLNLGEFDDGSSVSVVFEKAGKYTYHNHLNPSQTGTVTVE